MQPERTIDNNSILAQLKTRTAHQHQATENTVALMRDDFNLDDYRDLIVRFYAYYKPLEERISAAIAEFPIEIDHSERLNTPRLVKDLRALGLSDEEIEAISPATEFPTLDSKENIYGALYVIEGSTLGGQVISRHLKQKFEMDETSGAAFFAGYGKDTGTMWKGYGEAVTNFAQSGADTEKIIAGANQTFETIGKALAK